MAKYVEVRKPADYNKIATEYSISPLTARVLVNREVEDIDKFFNGTINDLNSPFLFPAIRRLVSSVINSINQKEKIRIINDYDVDGICSGFILLDGLTKAGANVDIYTPERVIDGYGMSVGMIEKAKEDNISLIITCDNGISAFDAINRANELGIKVIVTDHHEIPLDDNGNQKLVNAPIINCKIGYPFNELCGAGVAFKFIQALYSELKIPGVDRYLEYVAIATVCDVMPLIDENRIFVKEGLKNPQNKGIRALMELNSLEKLDAYSVGFIIGPCINATGRISYAKDALRLLLETDDNKIQELAVMLNELNEERKEMTKVALEQALKVVDETKKVLIVHLPDCHESISGIVAGRLKEIFYKPVIVFAGKEEIIKGSGRSVPEYHMFNELNKVKQYLPKFGGHPMAAGMSIKLSDLKDFEKALNDNCQAEEFVEKVKLDAIVSPTIMTKKLVDEIDTLAPFGLKNPKPVFGANVKIFSLKIIGKNKNVAKMILDDGYGHKVSGIMFDNVDNFMEIYNQNKDSVFCMIYKMSINEFRGVIECQCVIQDIFPKHF